MSECGSPITFITFSYAYYIATKNLKENQQRFKEVRQKFSEKDIDSFLLKIKMGETMGIYKILLNNPALVNVVDSIGRTALHWAVMRDHAETVRVLLHFRPNLTYRDLFGHTALEIAIDSDNFSLKNMMVNHSRGFYTPDLKEYAQEMIFEGVRKKKK